MLFYVMWLQPVSYDLDEEQNVLSFRADLQLFPDVGAHCSTWAWQPPKAPPNLSSLTVPSKGIDMLVAHLWGVKEVEERDSADRWSTDLTASATEPQLIRPVSCSRGLLTRPLKATNLSAHSILWATSTFPEVLSCMGFGLRFPFSIWPHLSESH